MTFVDQYSHEEHIRERLQFIVDFYKFYKVMLSIDHLNFLWKILANNPPSKANCEVFFKWMNNQVNSMDTKQYCVLNKDILEHFFSEYLISPDNKYATLESEGFNLIKTLFKLINEKAHKLQILNSQQARKEHGTVSSACGSTLTSTTYGSGANTKEFITYVHPDEMKGIEVLWKIVVECTDIEVIAHCIMFIDSLFHNLSDTLLDRRMEIEEDLVKKCISKIEELRTITDAPDPDPETDEHMYKLIRYRKEYALKQIERFFLHIRSFMENSERDGIDNFLLLGSLSSQDTIVITINNKIAYGKGCYSNKTNPRKFQLNILHRTTLWSIKQYCADKLGVDPVLLKFERIGFSSKEFKESDNSKTLYELGINSGEKFSITQKLQSALIDRLNIMFSDNTLTPEADRMFNEIFTVFTNEEGKMTKKTCMEFLKFCTSHVTDENDSRIGRLFSYDKNKDELLEAEEFKEFYRDSAASREQIVRSNIGAWKYESDFKQGKVRDPRDPKTLLRYILPRKKEYSEYFFSLLNEKSSIAQYSWELLNRLTIVPDIYEKLATLEDIDAEGNKVPLELDKIVDKNNPYQLMYLFTLINHFLLYNASNINRAHVIYNEDEFDAQQENELLEVKGTSVGTTVGTSTGTG